MTSGQHPGGFGSVVWVRLGRAPTVQPAPGEVARGVGGASYVAARGRERRPGPAVAQATLGDGQGTSFLKGPPITFQVESPTGPLLASASKRE